MALQARNPNTNLILTHDELLELCEADGTCVCGGLSFSTASVVEAMTGNVAVAWEELATSSFQDDFGYHEVYVLGEVSALGFIRFPITQSITTSIEIAIARCLIAEFSEDRMKEELVLFFSIGPSLPPAISNSVRSALRKNSSTFFKRNIASSLNHGPLSHTRERVTRHLIQSHDYHGKKYGFLELFRAAETCFLSSILENVKSKFMSSPERTLRHAIESINAESKAIKSVIDTSGSNQQAEAIADMVNQLRSSGNSFAVELYNIFERRTDKSDASKTWRASCYLFSVRCSIAHAGQDGLVYEDFSDADDVVDAIFSLFEDIIVKSIGLTAVGV